MIEFQRYPVAFEGKSYEIRILYDDSTINVAAFLNNHPATGFRHQIKIPKGYDVKKIMEKGACENLVELSKNDITGKRWDNVLNILRECRRR